jgi:biotin carboxylase
MVRLPEANQEVARVLLLLPTTSYRNEDFIAAANALGVTLITCANHCHQLAPGWGLAPMMAVHFDRPREAVEIVLRGLGHKPDAVLAVDDQGLELAALLCERLGLTGNPPQAVTRLRDKFAFRELLAGTGFNCPRFWHLPGEANPDSLLPELQFPVVVKARRLSASRGVIRADTPQQLREACSRVKQIQAKADRDAEELGLLVEQFIPGKEFALEGRLESGRLCTLALFDKPDPLDGPYFEETLYVAPSRLPAALQEAGRRLIEQVCVLAGLVAGPVHAEFRLNDKGIWLLEVAARSIGGLCSRVLHHALGMSLEELILRHAIKAEIPPAVALAPCGVMMIPIPRRGILREVRNLEAARAVPGINDIQITASIGNLLAPSPEGASYLGFIFARAETPDAVELALREAAQCLEFNIQEEVAMVESS